MWITKCTSLALCFGPVRRCFFVFCSLCNLAYHPGGTCLSPEAQLAILRQRNQGQRQNEEELRRREAEILNLATIKVRKGPKRRTST